MIKHKAHSANHSGVFPYLVNSAAFVDRIELSADEEDRKNPTGLIRKRLRPRAIESKPIGGKGSLYARQFQGRCKYSGNFLALKYGKLKSFTRVPSFRLVMRSDYLPLTGAQVLFATRNLHRLYVSLVEMTFDLTGVSLDDLWHQLFTRAEVRDYRGTIYVGSRDSHWQVRIYNKTESVVRLEFVFRRGFLRKHGIGRSSDLIKLRTLNIWQLISLRKLQKNAFRNVLDQIPAEEPGWTDRFRRVTLSFPQLGERILRTQCNIPTQDIFSPSVTQRLLQRMQRQFLW